MTFMQKLFTPKKSAPVKNLPAPVPASNFTPVRSGKENPFMVAMNQDSAAFRDTYGVNRPLKQPMFLGYRDNKALYGGSRLFILY